ncbi:MAG: AsnC family transcriptional regulator [Spirochaetes bacterium]|nr:MAG: AsnC family transcriptional regulator [Spirochaetota bacterium]
MKITTKGRYALRAVLTLAQNSQEKPVSIKQLAKEEDISPEFLEQIFFRLKKTGMISSTRGPGGGFRLNRNPSEITLTQILTGAGEGTGFTPCTREINGKKPCNRVDFCVAHEIWKEATEHFKKYFDGITLEEVLKRQKAKLAAQK